MRLLVVFWLYAMRMFCVCHKANGLALRPALLGFGQAVHTGCQTRDFARHGVLVQNAFADATGQFWLCGAQRCGGNGLIAGGNCLFTLRR